MQTILAIISILFITSFAYFKKQLTLWGSITAILVGFIFYLTGRWLFLGPLFVFFITSSIVTNINKKYKKQTTSKIHEKSSSRDTFQVLANSLIALIFAILYYKTKNTIFEIAVFIAFASYNADTWASELGIISKQDNIFLFGFKKVQKGISGAVTIFGLICSLLGSLLIGFIYFFKEINFKILLVITIYGFISALIDSILGQLCQVLYYDKTNNLYTEKKYTNKTENLKVKGFSWTNNDFVNLLAPLISIIFYIIYSSL